jgi:hypothetical protein
MVPRQIKALELGCIAMVQGGNLVLARHYTTVFQAEVYAIRAYTVDNLERNYKNRNICILSDIQAAIKAPGKHQFTSKLVWDCHQLAKHNSVQLVWVPGHKNIVGHETADQLARTGSEHPFIGPEPACGIQLEFPRRQSGTGRTEIIKTLGIHNWTQTGNTNALCQMNERSV